MAMCTYVWVRVARCTYVSSKGGGFGAGTTSCKRHEMSSKKLCGGGVG